MGKSKTGTASSSGQKNLGAKGPVKPVPASRGGPKKTQAEKDAARLEELRLQPRGNWIKATWQEFAELQEKAATHAIETVEPTFPAEAEPGTAGGAVVGGTAKAAVEVAKVAEKKDRKLEPPKHKFDGSGDFETFRRQVMIWWGKYKESSYSEQDLGAELMEVLSDKAVEAVFAVVDEGAEAISIVVEALDARFGKAAMPKATHAVEQLAGCVRGKRTLRSFINDYTALRSKAQKAGEVMCPNTSGTKLLKAAELAPGLHTQILSSIAGSGKPGAMVKNMPAYWAALEQLEIAAQTFESLDESKQEKRALLASAGAEAKGFGGEKKGGWGSKGGGKQKKGGWSKGGWQDKKGASKGGGKGGGKFGKSGGGKSGKGGGKAGGWNGSWKGKGHSEADRGLCWYIERGEACPYGASCKYSHKKETAVGGDRGAKRKAEEGGPTVKAPRVE